MRPSNNWTAKYMLTGQEKDKETSQYNYRARLYDPYLKRFLDTDPVGEGFTPYAYAGNNPVMFVDPTGEVIQFAVAAEILITAQAITTAELILATTAMTMATVTTFSIASQSQQILLAQTVPPNTSDQAIREGINNYKKYDGLNIPDASPQTPQKNPLNSFDPIKVDPSYGSLQEQPLSPARYYGGDGSGSLMDITMKGLDVVNQFNPVANAWDYVTYVAYGTDRLGNSMSHFGGYMSAFSAVPFLSATKSLTFTKFGVKTGAAKGGTKLLTQGRFPNFAKKFTKHSGEWSQWGSISKNAFYNRAVKLADSPVGGSIRGFTSKQGYGFRFNTRTGEFLTTHPNGTIQTFFRPKQGLDYYLKQVQLYGN
jgi:RHS repeat-associated protein